MHAGDRLLSINGTTLEQAAVEDAVQLLSQSGIVVRVEIAPHHLFMVRPGFNQEGETSVRGEVCSVVVCEGEVRCHTCVCHLCACVMSSLQRLQRDALAAQPCTQSNFI